MSKPFWTDERIAGLTKMLFDGVSYQEIGRTLGCGKNAAIGKARRIGISEGAKNAVGPAKEPASILTRLAALDVFPPVGGCVYPIGHPRTEGFRFCCGPVTEGGAPYCPKHDAKCRPSAAALQRMEEWANDPERSAKQAARNTGRNAARRAA